MQSATNDIRTSPFHTPMLFRIEPISIQARAGGFAAFRALSDPEKIRLTNEFLHDLKVMQQAIAMYFPDETRTVFNNRKDAQALINKMRAAGCDRPLSLVEFYQAIEPIYVE